VHSEASAEADVFKIERAITAGLKKINSVNNDDAANPNDIILVDRKDFNSKVIGIAGKRKKVVLKRDEDEYQFSDKSMVDEESEEEASQTEEEESKAEENEAEENEGEESEDEEEYYTAQDYVSV